MPAIVFISENPHKIAEYRDQMAQYGIDIETLPWQEDEAALEASIHRWLTAAEQADAGKKMVAYALNEWSDIYNAETHLKSDKATDMEPVYNKGELVVYELSASGALVKEHKEHRVYGYMDLSLKGNEGFGWDRFFVNGMTGKSYAESIPLWVKCTPSQLLISDFIQQRLFYKKRKTLDHADYVPEETISFASVREELENNGLFRGAMAQETWGLNHFVSYALADGIHLRFAGNRRENNYWMPGLNGGLPAVGKPDAVHEMTYRFHDLTHYGLSPACDLIPTDDFGPAARRVYHAARMMSEAFSLVMADMLFVDALKRSGVAYDYGQRNVYPVFESIVEPEKNLKALFRASVFYALMGDDRPMRDMMRPSQASAQALENFKEWYGRFFTADHVWTHRNFESLSQQGNLYKDWHAALGAGLFKRARVTTLNETVSRIGDRHRNCLSSYAAVVEALFEEIFEGHVKPRLSAPPVPLSAAEEISNAFRRYMLGQALFYMKYRHIPGMEARMEHMIARLESTAFFGIEDIADIRRDFKKDVMLASGAHVITHDDRRIFSQVFPVFPPVYLEGYAKQKSDIAGAVGTIFKEFAA